MAHRERDVASPLLYGICGGQCDYYWWFRNECDGTLYLAKCSVFGHDFCGYHAPLD
jgi:hypothetical protein